MGRLENWLADSLRQPVDPSTPTVTLSYAQSLDGSIALRRGERLTLSGPESQKMAHGLRAAHDAVLVGIGTVVSDDPQLSVRLVDGRSPQIIVLDSKLRTPLTARILAARPHIFCAVAASQEAQDALRRAGAIVERQANPAVDRVDLPAMLRRLKEIGIGSIMVEGGGEVISSFLRESLVDRVVITVSPQYVGGYKGVDDSAVPRRDLQGAMMEKMGKDYVIWGELDEKN